MNVKYFLSSPTEIPLFTCIFISLMLSRIYCICITFIIKSANDSKQVFQSPSITYLSTNTEWLAVNYFTRSNRRTTIGNQNITCTLRITLVNCCRIDSWSAITDQSSFTRKVRPIGVYTKIMDYEINRINFFGCWIGHTWCAALS